MKYFYKILKNKELIGIMSSDKKEIYKDNKHFEYIKITEKEYNKLNEGFK